MDFSYYEERLVGVIGKDSYKKDYKYFLKVYNAATKEGTLEILNELISEVRYQMAQKKINNPAAYLTSMIKQDIDIESAAITRFEGNLVEHPFYRHGKRSKEAIVFKTRKFDKNSNSIVESVFTTTSESLVPNHEDADIYKLLLKYYHEQGMPESGLVYFSRYDIAKDLKKPKNGNTYKQIDTAFKYLFDTKITSKEAFIKFKDKIFLNTLGENDNIRLLSRYTLKKYDQQSSTTKEPFKSRAVLGHYIIENMKLYYSTYIDWDFYISLRFSFAKRMYEYLQKKRGKEKKRSWKETFVTFANRMGSFTKEVRFMKRNLKPALEELIQREFIQEYKYTKDPTGKDYIRIIFNTQELLIKGL